jgi:hypothetical protein
MREWKSSVDFVIIMVLSDQGDLTVKKLKMATCGCDVSRHRRGVKIGKCLNWCL